MLIAFFFFFPLTLFLPDVLNTSYRYIDAATPTSIGKAKQQHCAKDKSEACKKKDVCNKKDTCKNDNVAVKKNTSCKNNAAKKEACNNNKKDVCNKDTREKDACAKPCKKAPCLPKPRCEGEFFSKQYTLITTTRLYIDWLQISQTIVSKF